MLNVYVGSIKGEIYNTSMYFDHTYLNEWLIDDLSQKMIKSIDKAEVFESRAIKNKHFGIMSIMQLSEGAKTLLLLQNGKKQYYNASTCGDNCAKWILKIAKQSKEDIYITLHHVMNFGDKPFEIRIVNNDVIVHNYDEYLKIVIALLHEND